MPGVRGMSYAPQVAPKQPTPWLGLSERIAQYVDSLWIAVFAVVLLRRENAPVQKPERIDSAARKVAGERENEKVGPRDSI
ncbi:MAG: hypothetical protein ABI361_08745 [Nitrososphaera sp.]